jgi:PAS domain S-box-containing protein
MSDRTKSTTGQVAILIVEDSPTQAEELRYLLERQGYQVSVAENGRQALALLGEQKPALIISDILMPGMNGYELCRRLKEDDNNGDIPVILLTSLSNPADVLESLECGADSFLTKPYSEDYLLAHIQQILANWKLRKNDRVRVGVEILFAGKRRFISADQQQMLSLLLSTYEAAVQRNRELAQTQEELRSLNDHLEDKVMQRTAALTAEIAERKRAEEALDRERRLLRMVIDNVPDQIFAQDPDGRFIFNNCSDALTMGVSDPETLLGKNYNDFYPPQLAARFHAEDRQIIESDQPLINWEEPTIAPDGKRRWTLTTKVLWRDSLGQVIGLVGVVRDITERKQAEQAQAEYSARLEADVAQRTQELRDAQEQLIRQEKLAVLGQLASGVAHELRNPLGVIANAVYFLKAVQPNADAAILDYLGIISAEVNNADKIVTDLLDFARIKGVARETTTLAALIEDVLQKYPPAANITVVSEYPNPLPPLFVDPRQIEQVLTNLVINACQAMPQGGALTLRAEGVSEPMSAGPEPSSVALQVRDTGTGISPENMKKLFEPLFTTKAKGIGLGLAVSKKLIEANGGRIEVQSEPGQGSTFTIFLPIEDRSKD